MREFNLSHMPDPLDTNISDWKLYAFGICQCSQEPCGVIHIALCAGASQSITNCAAILKYVLATYRITCAAHCNCCRLITYITWCMVCLQKIIVILN